MMSSSFLLDRFSFASLPSRPVRLPHRKRAANLAAGGSRRLNPHEQRLLAGSVARRRRDWLILRPVKNSTTVD